MSHDVVLIHGPERHALLGAILARAKSNRGTFVLQTGDTLARFLEARATGGAPPAFVVVGLRPRERDQQGLVRTLRRLREAGQAVQWFDVGAWPAPLREALLAECQPVSAIAAERGEVTSLVRERLSIPGELAETLCAWAAWPARFEANPASAEWLYALTTAVDWSTRLPGYLPALMTRLSGGIPEHPGKLDRTAASAGWSLRHQLMDRVPRTVTGVFPAGERQIAVADERLDRTLDWPLIARALAERGTESGKVDIQVVVGADAGVRVAALGPANIDLVAWLRTAELGPMALRPLGVDGVLTTAPGVAGPFRGQESPAVATIVQALVRTYGGQGWDEPGLAMARAASAALGSAADVAPLDRSLLSDAGPVAGAADLSLFRVSLPALPAGEPGLAAYVHPQPAAKSDGWREDLFQELLELQARHGFSRLLLKTPDGRYGPLEGLSGDAVLGLEPVLPAEAPRPWDAGHIRPRALDLARWPAGALQDLVRLVRVNPDYELTLDGAAVRLGYRGVELLELRRQGGTVGADGPLGENGFRPIRFKRLSPRELAQVAPLRRRVDQWLAERGRGRARVSEIGAKVVVDTRRAEDADYWVVGREWTFPEARHLRLDLLAVNRRTHRLAAVHLAVPGTAEYTRIPLRAMRLVAWLQGARLEALARDAEQVLAEKAALGLSGYRPVAVATDPAAPIETVLAVAGGHRRVRAEDDMRFARLVELLDPPGGLTLLDLQNWHEQPAVLRAPALELELRRSKAA